MYKKIASILLGIACAIGAEAYDKTALNDTLSKIASNHASVGKVRVKQVKQSGSSIKVYTNEALSWLSLSHELVDSLGYAAGYIITGDSTQKATIYSDDKELAHYITSQYMTKKELEARKRQALPATTPLVSNTSRPYKASLGLEGKVIALYGSHGLYFNQAQERWIWQRARMFTTVEDLYTTSYTMPFLVPMLENAGAIVIQPRERDRQVHEVIVDDSQANTVGWQTQMGEGWGTIPGNVLYEGENPFTFGNYAFCRAGKKASSMRYTPALPEEGEYAVYVSYKTLQSSTNHAQYTVMHDGIETHYSVNQQMGGSTWIYIGTFHFGTEPSKNYVSISAEGKEGEVVTTDAIRFGGGYGNIARYAQSEITENVPSAKENGKQNDSKTGRAYPSRDQVEDIAFTSGVPRWIEGARYWFQYSGIPDSVYGYTGGKNDYTDDYASRGRWVNYLIGGSAAYPEGPGLKIPVELAMAFHTDAGTTPDSSIIGTLIIYTDYDDDKKKTFPTGASRSLCRDMADYMQTQIVNDVSTLYAPEWNRRRLHNSSYAESRNPKVPCVLLEFLSHQNYADMKYGLDPSFRFVVSRAIYKSMLRFNHEQYGTPYIVQPLPVKDFAIRFAEGDSIHLSWTPREDQLEPTAKATSYVLYTRQGNKDWDNGVIVKNPYTTIAITKDTAYDFKVCALNDGGLSFPSEVLSACKLSNEKGKALIINGFDRVSAPETFESSDGSFGGFKAGHYAVGYMNEVGYIGEQYEFDRTFPWVSDDHSGFGACWNDKRDISPIGNTFDYPVKHGKALREMGLSYVSCSASSIDTIGKGYAVVDIILGKQKTTTIGSYQKMVKYPVFAANLRKALNSYNGPLLISGAYVGTDMQSEDDKAWTKKILHYTFRADNASHNGKVNIVKTLPRMSAQLVTEVNEKIIPCENPGGIAPNGGANVVARYGDSGVSAGIAYDGQYRQLIFSFPLESLEDFGALYKESINWLINK